MSRIALARPADFAPLAGSRGSSPGLLDRLLATVALARSRRSLAELDDRMLADLGLTREAALREAARPAWGEGWNAPAHWLR